MILSYVRRYIELRFRPSHNRRDMFSSSFLTFETVAALALSLVIVVPNFVHLLEPLWPLLKASKAPHLFGTSCFSSLWNAPVILILINMIIAKEHARKVRSLTLQLCIGPVILFKCPIIASVRSELLEKWKFVSILNWTVSFLPFSLLPPKLIVICTLLLWRYWSSPLGCSLSLIIRAPTFVAHVYFKPALQFQR